MGRHDKLLAQLLGGRADANIGFEAICALLRRLGFQERTRGGHHVFRRIGVEELIKLAARRRQGEGLPSSTGPRGARALRADYD